MQLELWHGTNQDFDRFDPGRLGLHTSNGASRTAFFFAASFETARDYALAPAGKMVPDASAHEEKVADCLTSAPVGQI